MSVDYKDYYKTLGVPRGAGADDIKSAYRKLARKYHPDLQPESRKAEMSEKFKEINEAYEVLSDDGKKRLYDQLGPEWENKQRASGPRPQPGRPAGGFSGADFGGGFYGGPRPGGGFSRQSEGPDMAQFSDFFRSIFGGADMGGFGGFSQPRREEPALELPLADALRGGGKILSIPVRQTCSYCGGTGRQGRARCPQCGGAGAVSAQKEVRVNFPAGIADGARLRLKGQGPDGGDLYLRIAIAPEPGFKASGPDLETEVRVMAWDAALGGEITVPAPDGPVRVKIPPGTRAGKTLKISGRGYPKGGGARGDLYARVVIDVPPGLSRQQAELMSLLRDSFRQ
ncbi:MAG: J domain-containing protein [Elusimicrobiales bacterium]